MRPTILLFDLDGTLLLTGGAGRRAMARAFGVVCGREDACSGFSFGGMTDRRIAREGLRAVGHADTDSEIDRLLDTYLGYLDEELAKTKRYRVLPGVHDVVRAVSNRPSVAVGLGTGNIREGALKKLGPGGLDRSFEFGGFGCDHEDRPELLRTGARRGAARLGVAIEDCRVVVIGDTPRDVEAATAIGAACIGVGTGGHSPEELVRLGAIAAFADLTDSAAADAILVG